MSNTSHKCIKCGGDTEFKRLGLYFEGTPETIGLGDIELAPGRRMTREEVRHQMEEARQLYPNCEVELVGRAERKERFEARMHKAIQNSAKNWNITEADIRRRDEAKRNKRAEKNAQGRVR